MPWEVTTDYIRSGHRSPSEFQEGSLRTITLSEEEGIKAVIGKPMGQNTTEVQSYLFDKSKGWTLEKAKAWFKEHRTQRAREHVNVLMPFQVMRKMTDKPLKIRGVATIAGIDKNLHIITEDELQKFAEKLVAAPIYYEHIQAQNVVGKVTRTEFDPETKALFYEAEIYEEDAQQKIRMGLINHVSIGANYGRLDVLDGIAFYDLYDAELSLVAIPAVSGTSIQVMQKLTQHAQTEPTGVKVSPAPSNATETSGMEEKKIEEKFQESARSLKESMSALFGEVMGFSDRFEYIFLFSPTESLLTPKNLHYEKVFRKERAYCTLEDPSQMPRKVVKAYLTPKQKRILEWICIRLDMDESAVLRQTFMEYAKSPSLITEAVHGRM